MNSLKVRETVELSSSGMLILACEKALSQGTTDTPSSFEQNLP